MHQYIYDKKDAHPDHYEITATTKKGYKFISIVGATHIKDWVKDYKVGDRVMISFTIKEIN